MYRVLAVYKDLSSNPQLLFKNSCALQPQCLGSQDRWTLGAHWPASLAQMVTSMFSERPCLMEIRLRVGEEDTNRTALLTHMFICACEHSLTCMCVYAHKHTHSLTMHKPRAKGDTKERTSDNAPTPTSDRKAAAPGLAHCYCRIFIVQSESHREHEVV